MPNVINNAKQEMFCKRNEIPAFSFKGEVYQNTVKTLISSQVDQLMSYDITDGHEIVGEWQDLECLPHLGHSAVFSTLLNERR